MGSLSALLVKVVDYASKSFFKNGFKALGLGLVSYAVLLTLFNTAMAYIRDSWGQLGEFFYSFNLAGIDAFISIILSYISVKFYLASKKAVMRVI
ncbi:DUF2523 family protein [Acinetobacter zhairhuonensis]|uniref:DUF2523 family protein n=1 Tax=Acinetobacter sp. A7.4 TaxID=2919921 RepID=UPI001F4F9D93|nr:DUF2523 family protein [Acinetobacter sp. A7.4]MCJ8163192.1 DUF2523 domain-containing protein [Acinetobacter sp. A7.4]